MATGGRGKKWTWKERRRRGQIELDEVEEVGKKKTDLGILIEDSERLPNESELVNDEGDDFRGSTDEEGRSLAEDVSRQRVDLERGGVFLLREQKTRSRQLLFSSFSPSPTLYSPHPKSSSR